MRANLSTMLWQAVNEADGLSSARENWLCVKKSGAVLASELINARTRIGTWPEKMRLVTLITRKTLIGHVSMQFYTKKMEKKVWTSEATCPGLIHLPRRGDDSA